MCICHSVMRMMGNDMKHIFGDRKLDIYAVVVSSFFTNCYIVSDKQKKALIIDPGDNAHAIISAIDSMGLLPVLTAATHCHIDHIMAVDKIKKHYGIPFCAHTKSIEFIQYLPVQMKMFGFDQIDIPAIENAIEDGGIIFDRFKVIHTPGHSPDAVCLYTDGVLFSGDTLFFSGIGRTDLPGGDYDEIINSITNKLMVLPDETRVFPGHGSETVIKHERDENPFL